MKTIVTFIGSPRKTGNTSSMANLLKEHFDAASMPSGILNLYDYKILPCIDCRGCKKNDLTCILKDDMKLLYDKMESSDYILFGTPIYWYGPTAVMKLLIDRLRPYYVNRKLEGKKAALILAAASGDEDTDLTVAMFTRMFHTLGIEFAGVVSAKAYEAGEALHQHGIPEAIENLAHRIQNNP
jgi:multimeric flavodoxin WrbA